MALDVDKMIAEQEQKTGAVVLDDAQPAQEQPAAAAEQQPKGVAPQSPPAAEQPAQEQSAEEAVDKSLLANMFEPVDEDAEPSAKGDKPAGSGMTVPAYVLEEVRASRRQVRDELAKAQARIKELESGATPTAAETAGISEIEDDVPATGAQVKAVAENLANKIVAQKFAEKEAEIAGRERVARLREFKVSLATAERKFVETHPDYYEVCGMAKQLNAILPHQVEGIMAAKNPPLAMYITAKQNLAAAGIPLPKPKAKAAVPQPPQPGNQQPQGGDEEADIDPQKLFDEQFNAPSA